VRLGLCGRGLGDTRLSWLSWVTIRLDGDDHARENEGATAIGVWASFLVGDADPHLII